MNYWSIFLRISAGRVIFTYGIKPVRGDFKEYTEAQYAAFRRQHPGQSEGEKLYSWLPPRHAYTSSDILTATEDHVECLLDVAADIDLYAAASQRTFKNYTEVLSYVATVFPPALSAGTMFDPSQSKSRLKEDKSADSWHQRPPLKIVHDAARKRHLRSVPSGEYS